MNHISFTASADSFIAGDVVAQASSVFTSLPFNVYPSTLINRVTVETHLNALGISSYPGMFLTGQTRPRSPCSGHCDNLIN